MFRKIPRAGRAPRTSRPIPFTSRFDELEEIHPHREHLRRASHRATRGMAEELERRVMLSVVPNTTPLHTGAGEVGALIKAAAELQKLHDEVNGIHDKLSSAFGTLPIVGTGLKDAIDSGTDTFNQVSGAIQTALGTLTTGITGVTVQNVIFAAFGPAGLNILPPSVASASDVPITLEDTDGNVGNGAEQVNLNLDFQGTLFSTALHPDFNLGLPGIGLAGTGTIDAQVNYDIKLQIAVNKADGFFINLGGSDPEASLTLQVTAPTLHLQGHLAFLQLDATDGTPQPSPTKHTSLTGTIAADLDVPGHKLKAGNVGSLLSNSTLSADAKAEVHVHGVVSFGGSAVFPSLGADFDLVWNIGNATIGTDINSASFGDAPTVEFNNISLNLGTFFSQFVAPVVNEINQILDPVRPIINILQTRMPVLSDIGPLRDKFDTNGDGTVTLLETIGVLEPSPAIKLIQTIVDISNFAEKIPTGLDPNIGVPLGRFSLSGTDPRGLTDLTGVDISDLSPENIAAELTSIGASIGGDTGAKVGAFLGEVANSTFGGGGGLDGGGLKFPLLDHPETAFRLFLGQDVPLFTFDMPGLQAGFHMDEFFPILGPLGVELKGDFDVKGHFAFGYDTFGLREFADGGFTQPLKLFDGFFISDTDQADGSGSNDIPELAISASIQAFAALNIVVASAGVGGGISANVDVNLHDPDTSPGHPNGDGKVRIPEIISQFEEGPLCLFDITGQMTAGLSAFVKVGVDVPFVGFVGWQKNFDIASATLLDFSFGCDPPQPDPVLATDIGDGVLRLNMGPFAADRLNHDTTDGNENFTVGAGPNPGDVTVNAFGFTQTFPGISKVYAEGGHGNDVITIKPGTNVTSELYGDFKDPSKAGDFGNDQLFSGEGAADLHGNAGDDQLVIRNAAGTAHGDDGNDKIFGGPNGDTLDGGNGDDAIHGGDGPDHITGDAGNDVLLGEGGADYIDAGDNDDQVEGGDGDDTLIGGEGTNVIQGDAGKDDITSGSGFDLITGDEADLDITALLADSGGALNTTGAVILHTGGDADTIHAGGGNDAVFGQGGDDQIFAEGGNDYVEGNDGADTIDGGAGDDRLIGGSATAGAADGGDSMTGGDGNDTMAGDNATIDATGGVITVTQLTGGDGADTMFGNAGDDNMFGEGGDDRMVGDGDTAATTAGNDTMDGGAGNDIMLGDNGKFGSVDLLGGAGNDTMSGGTGDDQMYGQGGNDLMHGNAGNDTMYGGDGNDQMFGDDDNDTMFGEAGTDTMDGGIGDDVMQGNADDDTMNGGAGNDNMQGNDGNDLMHGNAGNDTMQGNAGNDTMFGDEDNDNMQGNDGDDLMHGNAGNDTMFGNAGNDTMTGDDGDDYMEGNQGTDNMQGGNNDDDMIGGSSTSGTPDAGDTMDGGDGHDVMLGDNGAITRTGGRATAGVPSGTGVGLEDNAPIRNVTLFEDDGTTGNDIMTGGTGDDQMWGENGDDSMAGNDGNDRMVGGLGADTMDGGAGSDGMLGDRGTIAGDLLDGSNQQTIGAQDSKVSVTIYSAGTILWSATPVETSSDGNDVMTGGLGDDSVHGGGGADTIRGDAPNGTVGGFADGGADKLFGDSGNDVILADGGADHLFGGGGDDNLNGGTGGDIAYGGDGQDTLTGDVADDRLIDWFGNFNQFIVPPPGQGAPIIVRTPNPQMQAFLLALGTGDGATDSNAELQVVVPPSPSNSGPGPGH